VARRGVEDRTKGIAEVVGAEAVLMERMDQAVRAG